MKKTAYLTIVLALSGVPIQSFANDTVSPETVYSEGTEIQYLIISDALKPGETEFPKIIGKYKFSGEAEFNGKSYLTLNDVSDDTDGAETKLFPVINFRVEGNKVYAHPLEEASNPSFNYPVYDFDMQPGDIVKLSMANANANSFEPYYIQWVKCLERRQVTVDGKMVEEMEVYYIGPAAEVEEEDNPNTYTYAEALAYECPAPGSWHSDVWIVGIGQKYGLLFLTPWSGYSGGAAQVYSVTNGENNLYLDPSVKLPTNGMDRIEGESMKNEDNKAYSLDGTIISDSEKGIIIRNGKKYINK